MSYWLVQQRAANSFNVVIRRDKVKQRMRLVLIKILTDASEAGKTQTNRTNNISAIGVLVLH